MAPTTRRLLIIPLALFVIGVLALTLWRAGGFAPSAARSNSTAPASPSDPTIASSSAPPSSETSTTAVAPTTSTHRVLGVSIDGLNPQAITSLGPTGAPTFYRLMREGASTLNARTAREQTRTLPNHTGMLTGRRIDAHRGGHGVTFNSDKSRTTVHKAAGHYVASAFDVVHDQGGRTALFTAKEKFALYDRTWNLHGAPDEVGDDNGREKIDRFTVDTDNAELVTKLDGYLSADPGEFVFLHISLPDVTGHEYGFMGKRYLRAVQETDRLLGTVLDTITESPSLRNGTVVLVTADHGGKGPSHSEAQKLQNYRVPFFAWGSGIAAGHDLYDLNPSRQDPGDSRTTYGGPQPIRNGELANIATGLLGLPRVPGSEFDADQRLAVTG